MIDWNMILGVLLGFILALTSALVIQRLEWKREKDKEFRERIYGPLFRALNEIASALDSYEKPNIKSLDKILTNYNFYQLTQKLQNEIKFFKKHLARYQIFWEAAKGEISSITRQEAITKIEPPQLDVVGNTWAESISYRLFAGNEFITRSDLVDALVKLQTPLQLLEQESKELPSVFIQRNVGGHEYANNEKLDQFCTEILEKISDNPTIRERNLIREILQKKARILIEKIRKNL